jgi:hypothetical protein
VDAPYIQIVGGELPLTAGCGPTKIMAHADARRKGDGYPYVSGSAGTER